MPKQYEEIKRSYLRRGASLKKAKSIAAATFIKEGGDPKALHHKKKRRSLHEVRDFLRSKQHKYY